MYASEDSDNDSDFDIKYQQEEDQFKDLKKITQPLFITDLILGL